MHFLTKPGKFHFVFLAIGLSCLFSCQKKRNDSKNSSSLSIKKEETTISVQPPKKYHINQPLPVSLDVCPNPQTITVPLKPSTYSLRTKGGNKTIQLLPPVTTILPAGQAQGHGFFTTYTTEQGLALDAIHCSCIDHFGNIWFGTSGGGASRYDGKSFTNFTTDQGLANNSVNGIVEDKSGNIWFATYGGGVSRYDGKSFTSYTTKQGLANNYVYSILKDKTGNLWFGTNGGGVSCYNGKSFINYTTAQGLANSVVNSILEDKNGNIWFGTRGSGASCYAGKSFTTYTTTQGLANNNVTCILEDKTGNLWFGTHEGVSRYDGKSFTNFTTEQGLANNSVHSMLEDKSGNLWFATAGGGLSCYDGKSFINITTAQGLADNVVWSISEDKSGNLWFGTHLGGVSRYDGKSFANFTIEQGLANNVVFSILEDKSGNLWFGTEGGGVSRYDGKSFTSFTTAQGLANNNVNSILEDKSGNIWFGTDAGGLSRYDGKSFTNYTTEQGFPNNYVHSILEDKMGNIWFGTEGGGVSCYNGKSFTSYTTAQGLASNRVNSILEDKSGNLWFGTDGGGVSLYDGKSFTNYTTEQGLANNTVTSILEDKAGNIWFGTYGGGVSRYDGKSFTNYTTEQGLPDNTIMHVMLTKEQNIIFGTNFGVAVLVYYTPNTQEKNKLPAQNNTSNEELKNYVPVFEIYNSKTGYPVKDVNTNSMYLDSKGIIWAGTGSEKTALVRFDPSAVHRNPNPLKVILQSVKINEENICWYALKANEDGEGGKLDDSAEIAQQEVMTLGKVLSAQERDTIRHKFGDIQFDSITKFYPTPEDLILPYNHNSIIFSFAAIETSRSFLVRYQYILEGYDKDWSPLTAKTEATFGNIFEGTYTFKLKARSPDGVWSEPIVYTFKVLPPLYRTWWAYSIYGILSFLLFFGIYRWRTATLRKEKEILEQTVQTRTIEVVKQKDEAEKQKILVEQKNKDITDSINYAKRIQIALLKEEEHVSEHLPEHFILFKPKDIVSGDFYWSIEKEKYFYVAAVDCTGHGVPGGFMSMLGVSFLNEITSGSEILTPAEILNKLRTEILKELRQTGVDNESKDGMDISLMRMDIKTKEIQWSGANNGIYIIDSELKEILPDKQPIGYYPLMKPFTNHTFKAENNSLLYLFTDGYADQFGGPKGKKFKYRQLEDLLLTNAGKSMKEQKRILDEVFENWKGNLEQVDDVCIIGIKI
jgi:ligand-binding sensor domain-containing protein/serine phosphatase RsbU (regulator of sigma subunit)